MVDFKNILSTFNMDNDTIPFYKRKIVLLFVLVLILGILIFSIYLIFKPSPHIPSDILPEEEEIISSPIINISIPLTDPEFVSESITLEGRYLFNNEPTGERFEISFDKEVDLNETPGDIHYKVFENDEYAIAFFRSSEETGGEQSFIPEYKIIEETNLGKVLYRVQSHDQFTKEFKGLFSNTYEDYFYFTSHFQIGDKCGNAFPEVESCGNVFIFDENLPGFRIYCAANSEETVEKCDAIVKSVKVNL